MGIGIGGGLGLVRLGISTRGIGGGLGPLSVGGSWRGLGGILKLAFIGFCLYAVLLVAYVVFAWPFLLGTHLAVEMGASDPSTARSIVGWLFETPYLASPALVVVGRTIQRRRRSRELEAASLEESRRATVEVARLRLKLLQAVRADHETVLMTMTEFPSGVPASAFSHDVPAGNVLGRLPGVDLILSRKTAGVRSLQAVDTGTIWVTSEVVRFTGNSRIEEWPLERVVAVERRSEHLLLPLRGRKTFAGLCYRAGGTDLVEVLVRWGLALPSDPEVAREMLEKVILRVDERVAAAEAELLALAPSEQVRSR